MNAPDAKNPLSGFHVAVLMRRFGHVAPSFLDTASKVPMSWLFGSCRRSSHIATNRPFLSAAIHVKNWLSLAGLPLLRLIGIASDQVAPPSCDRLTSISPFP